MTAQIIKLGTKNLNIESRKEYEIKAIRLRLTIAIIEDILKK